MRITFDTQVKTTLVEVNRKNGVRFIAGKHQFLRVEVSLGWGVSVCSAQCATSQGILRKSVATYPGCPQCENWGELRFFFFCQMKQKKKEHLLNALFLLILSKFILFSSKT